MTTIYNICTDKPIPSYQGIRSAVEPLMSINGKFEIPELITLPNPMLPDFENKSMHLEQFTNEFTSKGILGFVEIILKKLESILGKLELPKIPKLDVDFWELISGNANALILKIKQLGITVPKFASSVKIGTLDALDTLQLLVRNYLKVLVDFVVAKVKKLKDVLFPKGPWPSPFPEVPEIPSQETIMAMLPENPTMEDLRSLKFEGIPLDFKVIIPSPLLPDTSMGSYDMNQGLKIMMAELPAFPLTLIMNFMKDIGLELTVPKLCFPIPCEEYV